MLGAPVHLFVHRATVYRNTNAVDSGGSPVDTYTLSESGVPCLVQTAKASEVYGPGGGGLAGEWTHNVYCENSADILQGDKLVVNGRTLWAGNVYQYDMGTALKRISCSESNRG